MQIAIIEDDVHLMELYKIVLADLQIPIDGYTNGWQGLDAITKHPTRYCLLILDIMLPGVNGLEICRKIRLTNQTLPILMLTSKSEDIDKIEGLELGADDYMTKPFSNGELLARVKAMLRRFGLAVTQAKVNHQNIVIGDIQFDIDNRVVSKQGRDVSLSAKEYDLLLLFMSQPGRIFTRMEILERVWGEHFEGLEHTVNSNINRLRLKIEDDINRPIYLVTVWGIGYKFNKDIEI